MQRIVQVRGPLLRDLALGYEQKDTYCDTTKTIGEISEEKRCNAARVAFLNKPNKPKPKTLHRRFRLVVWRLVLISSLSKRQRA